jgi:hypothetical protein
MIEKLINWFIDEPKTPYAKSGEGGFTPSKPFQFKTNPNTTKMQEELIGMETELDVIMQAAGSRGFQSSYFIWEDGEYKRAKHLKIEIEKLKFRIKNVQ